MTKLSAVVWLFLSVPLLARAQAPDNSPELPSPPEPFRQPVRFDNFTIANGLPQGSVYAIHQDRQGFIWFCTQDGISRYDGYTFKNYTHVPFDSTSAPNAWFADIAEDSSGVLWMAAAAPGGVSRLDPASETFIHYRHEPSDSTTLSPGWVTSIVVDVGGTIWAGSSVGGLNRMDPDEPGRFVHYRHDPDNPRSLSNNRINALDLGVDGTLWIGTANGLNRMDPASGDITQYLVKPPGGDASPAETGSSIGHSFARADRPDVRWIGTSDGLVRLDVQSGDVRRLRPDDAERVGIRQIAPDPNDEHVMWLASVNHGLYRFDEVSETFTHFRNDPRNPHSLLGDRLLSVHTDRSGTIWTGTEGLGVGKFSPSAIKFAHFAHDPEDPRSLPDPHVWGLLVDHAGALWVSTVGGWVMRIDRARGEVRRWQANRSRPPDARAPSATASGLVEASDGVIWMATYRGVSRYHPATDSFTHFLHEPDDSTSLSHNGVTSILEDKEGTVWVATIDGVLNRFDGDGFIRYEDSLAMGPVWSLHESGDGTLWLGMGRGIKAMSHDGSFRHYVYDPRRPEGITVGGVLGIVERSEEPGVLWLAHTGGGLDRFDTRTETFKHYTQQNSGLPNNTVYAILEDDDGRLWMSTNHGIARLDPESETFTTYGLEHGLQSLEFDAASATRAPDGEMFFGGVNGLNAFYPDAVSANIEPPPVSLTELRLFNEPVNVAPNSILRQTLARTNAIELTYEQARNVGIGFVALHFKNPERNRYRYRLDGFEDHWIDAGGERTAKYTNIPPGAYTFHVKAANSDGVWNEEGATLQIAVLPPWWRTTWAYIAYGMLLLGSVYATDRVQRRRLLRREREQARERELEQKREVERAYHELRVAKDRLVQQEKLASLGQLTAGIAHEIKNPLNFVNNFASLSAELLKEAEEILESMNGNASSEQILELRALLDDAITNSTKIAEHGERADGIVKSMLHHSRGTPGERQETDLNELLDDYVNLAFHGMRAQNQDFQCTFERDYDASIGRVEVVPQDLGRALINLLGNAFDAVEEHARSAPESYQPTVRVSTAKTTDGVEIRIEDNGPGIPDDLRGRIFEPFFTTKPTGKGTGLGLSITYDIISQGHGGELLVRSGNGSGTTFVIRLP